jgi:hypothetical protein
MKISDVENTATASGNSVAVLRQRSALKNYIACHAIHASFH